MARCRFCGEDVDETRPYNGDGRHGYGCRVVGRIQMVGLLEGWGRKRCSYCGKDAVAMRDSGMRRIYYCAEHAETPLRRKGLKATVPAMAAFAVSCYGGKEPPK